LNNTIELMAVVSGLHTFESAMSACVSTDSSSFTNGIAKWIYNWNLSGWRRSPKELDEAIRQRESIEFPWFKRHSGIPLNECAGMLVTKGHEADHERMDMMVPVSDDTSTPIRS
jgi:ribonuclease HI